MSNTKRSLGALGCVFSVAGCMSAPGEQVTISAAALSLAGVQNVCYAVAVTNEAGQTVWAQDHICADRYGNAAGGDFTYVGTCDASDGNDGDQLATNTVTLAIENLYTSEAPWTGDAELAGDTAWRNPCVDDPDTDALEGCSRDIVCRENADTLVEFNLTVMREANQGFFDIAVNFSDVFCSAKVDAVAALLHDGDARGPTAVLGFACTSGFGNTPTTLYLDTLTLTCDDGIAYAISPEGPGGQLGAQAPGLFQAAIYQGQEQLSGYDKCFWNAALGLGPALGNNCRLTVDATAAEIDFDAHDGAFWSPSDAVYPFIHVDVQLTGPTGAVLLGAHPLDGGDGVATAYTASAPLGQAFDYAMPCGGEPEPVGCNPVGAPYGGGDGSSETPYLICSRTHLENVSDNADASFLLITDLDLGDADWAPLSTFAGTFDGDGHTLSNMHTSEGLFAELNSATIHDLVFTDAVVSGPGDRGTLAGAANGATIERITVDDATLACGSTCGGLVGSVNESDFVDVTATFAITISGGYAGGLVGAIDGGSMSGCTAHGTLSGSGYSAGGVAGEIYSARVTNCTTDATVSVAGADVGGFVGALYGGGSVADVSDCHATGDVTGDLAGGFAGVSEASIERSTATGDVTGDSLCGGFVGNAATGWIRDSFARGDATCVTAGGFIGYSDSNIAIDRCFAAGDATGSEYAGGFIADMDITLITNAYATGAVSAPFAGGFAASYDSAFQPRVEVQNVYATGLVTGTQTGGLLWKKESGTNTTRIVASFFDTDTTAQTQLAAFATPIFSGCAGLPTTSMQTALTFSDAGWSSAIWTLVDGSYPTLIGVGP